jgi:hypothetical protein
LLCLWTYRMNTKLIALAHRHTNKYKTKSTSFWLLYILKRRSIVSNTSYRTLNIRSKYKCLHVISPERNKAILTWLFKILSICENPTYIMVINIYKINFDRPPHLKKIPEALIITPELRHLYIQTDRHKFSNLNLDRLYITRPKRLDTSKRRHAILHVKNSVLPSAANSAAKLAHLRVENRRTWTVDRGRQSLL